MADSVAPDQTPQNAASDLGLHCLQVYLTPCYESILFGQACLYKYLQYIG